MRFVAACHSHNRPPFPFYYPASPDEPNTTSRRSVGDCQRLLLASSHNPVEVVLDPARHAARHAACRYCFIRPSSAQNNMAAVSADGSTVWVLIRRLNSSCRRSIAFVVLALRHWVGGRRVKVIEALCGLRNASPAEAGHSRWRATGPVLEARCAGG